MPKTQFHHYTKDDSNAPTGEEIVDFLERNFSRINFEAITLGDKKGMEFFDFYQHILRQAGSPEPTITVSDMTRLYQLKNDFLEGEK